MRLIDADAFLSQIEDQYMEHDITREKYMDLEDRIMQQPTIEERKKGSWIYMHNEDGWKIWYECSECGKTFSYAGNYCPECGAKMRGNK